VSKGRLTLAIWGCLLVGVPSCSSIEKKGQDNPAPQDSKFIDPDVSELMRHFQPSVSQKAADRAAVAWPECMARVGKTPYSCSKWNENSVNFNLTGIRGNDGSVTPVIESYIDRGSRNDQVIIHLTGGTDLSAYSYYNDARTSAMSNFHSRDFRIVSIGYWGTNFRTNLLKNEIFYAAKDFANVYNHYSETCKCKPGVVAESLGAAILFHYLNTNEDETVNFVAISPVLDGIESAVNYFKSEKTTGPIATSRTSNVYELQDDGEFKRIGKRLVGSLDHLSSFAGDVDTKYNFLRKRPKCLTFVVGELDPLNAEFDFWKYPEIVRIEGMDHGLSDLKSPTVEKVLVDFVQCVKNSNQQRFEIM
jgi:hypothetical protein